MSESKKEKEGKKSSKNRLKSIYVFGESSIGKDGEFLQLARELGYTFTLKNMNFVYRGGI